MLFGFAVEVENTGEMEEAVGKDEMVFVKSWAVMDDVGEECCCLSDVLKKSRVLLCCAVVTMGLVG